MNEAELQKLLLQTFRTEAVEHIELIGKGLVELENKNEPTKTDQVLEEIYRAAHSMKGAARAVSLLKIEKLCQSLETCFSLLRKKELKGGAKVFDIFHSVLNTVEMLLSEDEEEVPDEEIVNYYLEILSNIRTFDLDAEPILENMEESFTDIKDSVIESVSEDLPSIEQDSEDLSDQLLKSIAAPKEDQEKFASQGLPKNVQDTIRLSAKKIDDIYLLTEETLQIKLSHNEKLEKIKELRKSLHGIIEKWSKLQGSSTQSVTKRTERQKNTVAVDQEVWFQFEKGLKQLGKEADEVMDTALYVSGTSRNIIDNLIDEVKHVLMVPFSNLLSGFPRIARDLARDIDKLVELEIDGGEVEVDRRIMEQLKDPLIHIIRNAVDHGIESPEERERAGKRTAGSISINIYQLDANQVQVKISDDGAGINKKQLLQKAFEQNLIPKEDLASISDQEIHHLIFKSGLSATSIITDISGRGLGMAIVEENVEKLGGKIEVKSTEGQGCTFLINIPTSISKSQGLLVKLDKEKYIISVSNIIETLRVDINNLKKVENTDTIQYRGSTLSLVHLNEILEVNHSQENDSGKLSVVVVESFNQKVGLVVDEIEKEQEVLFKAIQYPIKSIRNVAGVTLLGTGEICPILNNQDLVRNAMNIRQQGITSDKKEKKDPKAKKSILMAEDSITSRLFIKNILESAGFNVKACVDGKDALTALKQDAYDLLLSDVEMPRMDGFALTEAVRKMDEYQKLPIVLVTSLSKREHQERGIDAGANAYIVKGSFEKSNLLKVINRLI